MTVFTVHGIDSNKFEFELNLNPVAFQFQTPTTTDVLLSACRVFDCDHYLGQHFVNKLLPCVSLWESLKKWSLLRRPIGPIKALVCASPILKLRHCSYFGSASPKLG